MSEFPPTAEQQAAIDAARSGRSMALEALAGTGKTTTLEMVARALPGAGQYTAFNRAIVDEAKARFPSTVRCSTAHGMAMGTTGKMFRHRLNSKRVPSWQIAKHIGATPILVESTIGQNRTLAKSLVAGLAVRAVKRFCFSADEELAAEHVPGLPGLSRDETARLRELVLPMAKRVWQDVCSAEGQLRFEHDYYLKMYQLGRHRLHTDFILFDEAQDANPVMMAIVEAQDHAQRIWVGDRYQQIYSWRGAVNAMELATVDERSWLTQSWRFGPEIAGLAGKPLRWLGATKSIVGNGPAGAVMALDDPDVVLCRTNAECVRGALNVRATGRNAAIVGGAYEMVRFAEAARQLMEGETCTHPELACFATWGEVLTYVDEDQLGIELKAMVKLVEDFGTEAIESLHTVSEAQADVVFSTAHKAKGREWNDVQLAGDFPDVQQMAQMIADGAGAEELRLLYVAVTRAQRRIDIDRCPVLGYDTLPEGRASRFTGEEG